MHFFDILRQDHKQEEEIKATNKGESHENSEENKPVSLSLGFSSRDSNKDEKKNSDGNNKLEDENLGEGLRLGRDIRFDLSAEAEGTNIIPSPESNCDDEGKEEKPTEIWPPSKVLKRMRSGDNVEASQPAHQLKKARVSIRARCDTQTMNDGCQWRKYGQKIAKGNPCPRAYYRCTVSSSCPVKKKVQRCAEDMSILNTTYEGTHNHPLPISATAMASTTSVAASILQSPSFTSQSSGLLANSDHTAPIFNSSSTPNNIFNNNALNFSTTSQIPRPPQQQQHFYFPNSSISTSNSHPTITLDLTAPPTPLASSHHLGKFTNSGLSPIPGYYSSRTFNLSPSLSESIIPSQPNYGGYFNYETLTHNRNQSVPSILNTGKQPFHQPNHYMSNHGTSQETIAAATKTITTNPKFQSVLAAALTTYAGNGGAYSSGSNGIECTISSRNLNVSSSSAVNAQQGNLVLFPPSLPSLPASASGSGSDRGNQMPEEWKRRNLTIAPKESNLS